MAFTTENAHVFLAVLEHGSFSAAARALGKVPSAVSMAIAQLEAELDLQLFDRRGREPQPTAVARSLEPQVRLLQRQKQQLDTYALQLHQGLEQPLSIAVVPELLSADWSEPLRVLAQEFPALEVEVRTLPQTDAVQLLNQRAVHLAVLFERPVIHELEAFQEIGDEVLMVVTSAQHPLAKQPPHTLHHSDLAGTRQIMVAGSAGAPDPRIQLGTQVWRVDNHLATLSLVQAGLGWAYLPSKLVQPLIKTGQLHALTFANMSNQLRLWVDVVWRLDTPLGLGAQRYIQLLQQSRPPTTRTARKPSKPD